MTPLDFLAAVLPSPGNGYYCAVELTTNKKQHVFGQSLEEIQPTLEKWAKKAIEAGLKSLIKKYNREKFRDELGSFDIALSLDELKELRSSD